VLRKTVSALLLSPKQNRHFDRRSDDFQSVDAAAQSINSGFRTRRKVSLVLIPQPCATLVGRNLNNLPFPTAL
jgi:hypothetical protein